MTSILDNSRCIDFKLIHNQYTLPEGFQGDAPILDNSQLRASALEQSSRSSVSAIGLKQTPGCWIWVCRYSYWKLL